MEMEMEMQELKKYLLFDIGKNILDVVTNYAALYPAYFHKSTIGLLAAMEGLLWIVDYLRLSCTST